MWKDLLDILGKLEIAYRDAIPLLQDKKKALIGLNFDAIKDLSAKEKTLTEKIESLEKQRLEIFSNLAKQNSNITADMKLKDLFQLAPNKIIEQRLVYLQNSLTKNIEEVTELSSDTQVLANAALGAVQYHLNRLSGATVEPTYGKSGNDVVSRRKNYDFQA